MCSSALGYNLTSLYLNKTLPDLTPLVGYFPIFDMVRHFHFSLFCNLSQLRCFAVIMKTTHEPNSGSICSSPNLNSCRVNDVQRKSVRSMPTLPYIQAQNTIEEHISTIISQRCMQIIPCKGKYITDSNKMFWSRNRGSLVGSDSD